MKYVVILGDGMADYPVDAFDGKTILEVADKPTIDYMAQHGEMGMVKTVQDGMKPGSDVANLSVMGYDTKKCYSGRSPLEAASIGVPLKDNDVTFRCNLVTLSDEENYEDKTMLDYSAGEITTEEAAELIKAVAKELDTDMIKFYPGISYRHLTVWKGGSTNVELTPPTVNITRYSTNSVQLFRICFTIIVMVEKVYLRDMRSVYSIFLKTYRVLIM